MRCIILNRNYPPNPGVTGSSANELAQHLMTKGIEVHIVSTKGQYAGGGLNTKASGHVHLVSSLYSGKQKLLRLLSNLVEGFLMTRKASSLGIAPWICMTDPPLLNYWVGRYAHQHQLPWAYWSMDLYPEAFVSAHITSPRNWIYRHLTSAIRKFAPQLLIALGPKQAQAILQTNAWSIPCVQLPCGIFQSQGVINQPAWANVQGKIILGYAGNLGEAHDPQFIEQVLRHMDPSKHHFILSCYGAKAAPILALAKDLPGVTILPTIPQHELQYIDIHLATLLPHWDHVCVPSKAVSSICQGAALLFSGSTQNDNAHLLGKASWLIDPYQPIEQQVADFFKALDHASLANKKFAAKELRQELATMKQVAFEQIAQFIKGHQQIQNTL